MSYEVDYLPFAASSTANVDGVANYTGSGYQLNGFTAGLLPSKELNQPIRQASMIAAAVANFISNTLSVSVLDDGNLANLVTLLTEAIDAAATGQANKVVTVAYSAAPIFDASQGSTFEMVLSGDVTGATLVNITPGQRLLFIIKQDATGGHAFNPPGNLPMASIQSAASSVSIQPFVVDSGSTVYPTGPLVG